MDAYYRRYKVGEKITIKDEECETVREMIKDKNNTVLDFIVLEDVDGCDISKLRQVVHVKHVPTGKKVYICKFRIQPPIIDLPKELFEI